MLVKKEFAKDQGFIYEIDATEEQIQEFIGVDNPIENLSEDELNFLLTGNKISERDTIKVSDLEAEQIIFVIHVDNSYSKLEIL